MNRAIIVILTAVVLMTGHTAASANAVGIDRIIAVGEAALQADPNNAEARRALVDAYLGRSAARERKGELDLAIADYDRAIALAPDNVSAYSGRGFVYRQKGNLNEAIANYGQAIALAPGHVSAYIFRAQAHLAKNDLELGIADGETALRIEPDNVNAKRILSILHAQYGAARLRGGDQILATAHYYRSIELDTANIYPRHLLATLRNAQRITAAKVDSIVTELAVTKAMADSVAAKATADSVAAVSKIDSIITKARADRAIAVSKINGIAAKARADSIAAASKIDSVITKARADRAIAVSKINGIAAKAKADSIAAASKIDSIITKARADSIAAVAKIDSAVARAKGENVIVQHKNVVEIRPSATDTVTVLAMEAINSSAKQIAENLAQNTRVMIAAFTSGDENTSRYFMEELSYALYKNGVVPVDRENLEYALKELGLQSINIDDEAALRDVGKLVYANVTLQGSLTDLGDIYRYGTTGTAVGTGLVVRPTRFNIIKDEATERAIAALASQDMTTTAASRERAARDRAPVTAGEFLDRGMMFARLGDHERAIADFDEAQRLDPQMASTYFWRGSTLRRSAASAAPADAAAGEEQVRVFEEAIAALDRAIQIDPEFTLAYTIRGAAYNNMGDALRALEDFKRALELNPALAQQIVEIAQQKLLDTQQQNAATDTTAEHEIDPEAGQKTRRFYGRIRSGPVAAFSLQSLLNPSNIHSYGGIGVSGGYAVSVPLLGSDKLSVEMEVHYLYRSIEAERPGSALTVTLTESEISFPILFRYAFAPPGEFTAYLEAGISVDFPFGARLAFKNSDSNPISVIGRDADIYLVGGIGTTFKLWQVWYLGYRISAQLDKYVSGDHGTLLQNSIGLGLMF